MESVFLILLLILPSRGDDSCSSMMWKCGDICLRNEYQCECGGKELNYAEDMWCCYTGNCKSEKSNFLGFNYISHVSCEGAAVSLTEPCQGGMHHRKCPAETGITRKHNSNGICNSKKETNTSNAERQNVRDDNLTIVLVVAGTLLFFVFIAACCTVKMSKKGSDSVVKEDFNPVYGDYFDTYQHTEIYDRNPEYSTTDIEETGATVIRDNNPHYE